MNAIGLALAAMLFMAQDAAPPDELLDNIEIIESLDLSEHLDGLEQEESR